MFVFSFDIAFLLVSKSYTTNDLYRNTKFHKHIVKALLSSKFELQITAKFSIEIL